MVKLEDIKVDAQIRGLHGDEIVRIISVTTVGDSALTVVYKKSNGEYGDQMLFRTDESRLFLATQGRAWAFDASGDDFKLAIEAWRIQLAHHFDPMMAVHTSNVDPLPHQIAAVYEAMLPRQPLRFVLADDPGAGKTIMAGLLIRELLMRADARRILVVSPGSLTEQWQDELLEKFSVKFEVFSKEKQDQCATGNYFEEQDLLICRLDQLSRNEDYQQKLRNTDWDLIIVDEAHKLSASYYGNKVNKTKRFELGELLGSITRHFLLMTATPHNGKEEDFQIWLSLLDGDRFYGKFREGAHKVDVSDLMRRMVKEELLKFDGTKLFPERLAYTANYSLSDQEAALYHDVTEYVRNQMNLADRLDGQRKNNVGFALTQLQRRLASSPEAIFQSLRNRRKRLENRIAEEKLHHRGAAASVFDEPIYKKRLDIPDNFDEVDDELSAAEYEQFADQLVDQASAAETIAEMEAEVFILESLEKQAQALVASEKDRKWEELSSLLQDSPEMFNGTVRRKLIIFTEHRATLDYLVRRIGDMLGNSQAIVTIHGGTNRDERRKVQEEFRQNPNVLVLIATDAAGEGVNLQNANLMVNYDLPWNPNRLEQRFGRIHRIGQDQVCHLWNVVANETREGEVFQKLFNKLEIEKQALGGKVFDILGEAFDNVSLKDLLVEAIRYGDSPEVKARQNEIIEGALDTEHLREILRRNALVEQQMGLEQLYAVKEEMEKAEARKLQPYFIKAFFEEAFKKVGGVLNRRENGRYEISYVPATLRERDRVIGESRTPVLKQYERIAFEKQQVRVVGKPMADLIHPAHPLMNTLTDITLSNYRSTFKQGAVLIDPNDDSTVPKVLFMLDHSVREGVSNPNEQPKIVSRRLQFVEIDPQGKRTNAGWAPHLDLVPISDQQRSSIADVLNASWITRDLEHLALQYASEQLVPEHFEEVSKRVKTQATRVLSAVHQRLTKEIDYWSDRYEKLKDDVAAGKQPRIQPENARRRCEELTARLEQRTRELRAMQQVSSASPLVVGGALIIPSGLLAQRQGDTAFCADAEARSRIEWAAMNAVIATEQSLGHSVKDVSAEKCGWDITSRPPVAADGSIKDDRHIEVKGRAKGATTVTVTKNEIFSSYNQGEKYILAIVLVDGEQVDGPYYIKHPFKNEPEFGVASVNYDLTELLARAVKPEETL